MGVTAYEIKKALADKHWKDFFVTECKSGPTFLERPGGLKILDALAIKKSWTQPCFTGYEVKVSRSDFLRDVKFYTYEEIVNCLYIVCPKGMIDRTEVPESVGLMYYDPEAKAISTRKKAIYRKIEYSPDLLLYVIYTRLDNDRIPFFESKAEFFREYVAGKRDNRSLARDVRSKLVQENARLEQELAAVEKFKRERMDYEAIKEVLKKHKIYGWRHGGSAAEELDITLSQACPADIIEIRRQLENVVDRLRDVEERRKGEENGT